MSKVFLSGKTFPRESWIICTGPAFDNIFAKCLFQSIPFLNQKSTKTLKEIWKKCPTNLFPNFGLPSLRICGAIYVASKIIQWTKSFVGKKQCESVWDAAPINLVLSPESFSPAPRNDRSCFIFKVERLELEPSVDCQHLYTSQIRWSFYTKCMFAIDFFGGHVILGWQIQSKQRKAITTLSGNHLCLPPLPLSL